MDSREPDPAEECSEENSAQSIHSPGTVQDEEMLVRFIYRGEHVGDDGLLAPAALPINGLLEPEHQGLSVARSQYMTLEELSARAGTPQSDDRLGKYAETRAGAVRGLTAGGASRAFCVVDAGEIDFPTHALIRLDNPKAWTRSSLRRLRNRLLRHFTMMDFPTST